MLPTRCSDWALQADIPLASTSELHSFTVRPGVPAPSVYLRVDATLGVGATSRLGTVGTMGEALDVDAMINRFRERAQAVRNRPMPPLEGPDRKRFVERMQLDYQDFAMLGDAAGSVEDGFLVLRVDLRPDDAR
jgi:hypothetical protein